MRVVFFPRQGEAGHDDPARSAFAAPEGLRPAFSGAAARSPAVPASPDARRRSIRSAPGKATGGMTLPSSGASQRPPRGLRKSNSASPARSRSSARSKPTSSELPCSIQYISATTSSESTGCQRSGCARSSRYCQGRASSCARPALTPSAYACRLARSVASICAKPCARKAAFAGDARGASCRARARPGRTAPRASPAAERRARSISKKRSCAWTKPRSARDAVEPARAAQHGGCRGRRARRPAARRGAGQALVAVQRRQRCDGRSPRRTPPAARGSRPPPPASIHRSGLPCATPCVHLLRRDDGRDGSRGHGACRSHRLLGRAAPTRRSHP